MDLFGEISPPPPPPPEKKKKSVPAFMEESEDDQAPPPAQGDETLHPRQVFSCLGQGAAESLLLETLQTGRMPHGLIFAGPKGIGKATFAFRLARFLLKFGAQGHLAQDLTVPPEDMVSNLVASGAHPDLLYIQRAYDSAKGQFKGSVAVEDIRKVTPFLRMTASYGGARVVIIDDADTMSRSAQNALLKILEEPPAHAVLILVTHALGAMIPTTRSRCRVVKFTPPDFNDFKSIVSSRHPHLSVAELKMLYQVSEASTGKALQYVAGGSLDIFVQVADFFDTFPALRWTDIHALSEALARGDQKGDQQGGGYNAFQEYVLWVFRRMIARKARGQVFDEGGDEFESFARFMDQSSLEKLMDICDKLQKHFDTVSHANLDKRQAVLSAFSILTA